MKKFMNKFLISFVIGIFIALIFSAILISIEISRINTDIDETFELIFLGINYGTVIVENSSKDFNLLVGNISLLNIIIGWIFCILIYFIYSTIERLKRNNK